MPEMVRNFVEEMTMSETCGSASEYIRSLIDPDRKKAGRVTGAMFKMTKIIIADLEAPAAEEV